MAGASLMVWLDRKILSFIAASAHHPPPEGAFDRLALEVFAYQFKYNKIYKKFCLAEGKTLKKIRHWRDIPAMPTVGFKELVLTTFPVKEAVRVFKTSGTSEEQSGIFRPTPGRGTHFFESLKLYEAAIIPSFDDHVLKKRRGYSFYFLISPPSEAIHSSLSHMMGVVNRQFAKDRGKFYVKNGEFLLEKLARDLRKEKKAALLLSTAFALKGFLDTLKKQRAKISLPAGSRLMETGGFKGKTKEISKAALYSACGTFLGIPKKSCISEYGMTELSSQCYGQTLFKGPAWMRTLVIDPKTGVSAKKGQTGLLRHFDLANRSSVLAIQTEDLGRAAGDGFELLGRAPGSELRGCSLTYEKFLAL